MASDVKRVVSTAFWNDRIVSDLFSPEDKLFYLYLLTNPHTTQLGIYELPISKAAYEIGYSRESVKVLLDRFENKYGMIRYSDATGEVAIRNYLKHSVVKGGKPVLDCLLSEKAKVKDTSLLSFIASAYKGIERESINSTVYDFIKIINENENDNDNENDNENENENERIVVRIVNESSKKKSNKETQDELLTRLVAKRTLSEPLVNKLHQWIAYKQEKGNTYKELGLNALLSQLETREQDYGSVAVIDLIDTCMARNYQGIIFEILEKKATVSTSSNQRDLLKELSEV